MTRWLQTFSIVLIVLIVAPSLASAACDTPRQAVATFLDNLQPEQDQPDEAIACFDWSGGPAGRDARIVRARELKAVLDGKGLFIDYASVPDDPDHTDAKTGLALLPPMLLLRARNAKKKKKGTKQQKRHGGSKRERVPGEEDADRGKKVRSGAPTE